MIDITFNKRTYQLPNSWDDLTPEQFIYLSSLIAAFNAKAIDLVGVRALLACHLLGLSDRFVHHHSRNERFNENIYRIGNELRFFFKYEYQNTKSFNRIPKAVRDILVRTHPDELGDSTHVRWARKATKRLVHDFVFAKQQIPVIRKRRTKLTGYEFALDGNLLNTNLTARQFADALALYNEYIKGTGSSEKLLNKLVAVLYCNPYSPAEAAKIESTVAALPSATRQAVAFNFMAVQTFLFTRTKYAVLFNVKRAEGNAPKKKDTLGFGGSIITMTRKGYGSLKEMDNTNLLDFFEAMYSDLCSTIEQLKEAGMDLPDIASKTGLTVKTINEIL